MFAKFLNVNTKIPNSHFSKIERYSDVKQAAVHYQTSKAKLFEALNKAGCGHWIEKPVEQDQFSVAI